MATNKTATRGWQVDGPVPGAITLLLGRFDLGAHGYVVEEFFLTGTATSYRPGASGVQHASTADYRTRLVVVRPKDRDRFRGTVVVEWFNVSGGLDGCPDWAFMHRQIMRSGGAYVGVSAQKAGIEGGGVLGNGAGLHQTDPDRYGSLHHPGDAFSFDIYSHAGQAVRDRTSPVLGGAGAARLIAVGESQSAGFLVTYVNNVDPLARAFDAFLVHGRSATGAGLEGDPSARLRGGGEVDIERLLEQRRSLAGEPIHEARVPTITLQSETDVRGGGISARCHDGVRTRLWEVAGAAHFDTWGLIAGHDDDGTLTPERLADIAAPTDEPLGLKAQEPVNAGPQQHYVLQAALAHLDRWTGGGPPAPHQPWLDTDVDGEFRRDEHGNVTGGVRTPWVDVSTAVLTGTGAKGGGFTALFGVTRPFDAATLGRVYPGGKDEYLRRFEAAAEEARAAGVLLDADIPEILAVAAAAYPA